MQSVAVARVCAGENGVEKAIGSRKKDTVPSVAYRPPPTNTVYAPNVTLTLSADALLLQRIQIAFADRGIWKYSTSTSAQIQGLPS